MRWHLHWAALVDGLRLQVQHGAGAADRQTARILYDRQPLRFRPTNGIRQSGGRSG